MGLKTLKIIGNGDAFGSGGHLHTCFFAESSETKFLMDLGATAIHKLESKINLNEIDLIIISHFHGDHFGGIPFFLMESTFVFGREKPLIILGPGDCKNRVMALTEMLYRGLTAHLIGFDIIFQEYESGTSTKIRDLDILTLPAVHSPESNPHSLKVISGNNSLAYSGDTEWTDDLYRISEGTDYFICECTYFSTKMDGHINYLQNQNKLKNVRSKKVLLTHLGPEMLDQGNRSDVEFEYSEENKIYLFR